MDGTEPCVEHEPALPAVTRVLAWCLGRMGRSGARPEATRAPQAAARLRARRWWAVAAGAYLIALAAVFWALTRCMTPRFFPDSFVYLETAHQPIQLQHFFFPKPFTVPALYRLFDGDAASIVAAQQI